MFGYHILKAAVINAQRGCDFYGLRSGLLININTLGPNTERHIARSRRVFGISCNLSSAEIAGFGLATLFFIFLGLLHINLNIIMIIFIVKLAGKRSEVFCHMLQPDFSECPGQTTLHSVTEAWTTIKKD